MHFELVNSDNILEISEYFKYQSYKTCDYTIGGVYMWKDFFSTEYSIIDNMLVFRNTFTDKTLAYTIPIGKGSVSNALDEIENCQKGKGPLVFCSVPKCAIGTLDDYFGSRLSYEFTRDWSDYLYSKDDIIQLQGKKYNRQRNHINKFSKSYYGYEFCKIDKSNIARVKEFFQVYLNQSADKGNYWQVENEMTQEMIEHFLDFKLLGGCIVYEGNIVAFSIGEIVNDTLFVHIEKALREYNGIYSVINNEFAQNFGNEVLYINREEDLGDPGLRDAKTSYHPYEIVEKYTAMIKD